MCMSLKDILSELKKMLDDEKGRIDERIKNIDKENDQIIEYNNNIPEENKLRSRKRNLLIALSSIVTIIGAIAAFKIPGFINNNMSNMLTSIPSGKGLLSNAIYYGTIVLGEAVAIGLPVSAIMSTNKFINGKKGRELVPKDLEKTDELENHKKLNNENQKSLSNALQLIQKYGKESSLEQKVNIQAHDIKFIYDKLYNESLRNINKYVITDEMREKYAIIAICYVSLSDQRCNNIVSINERNQDEIIRKICQVIEAISKKEEFEKKKARVRRMDRYKEEDLEEENIRKK